VRVIERRRQYASSLVKYQEVDDVLSRRRSKTLVSLLAVASVGTLAASTVSATTEPPGTEPVGTEAAGTEAAGTEAAGTEAAGGGGAGEVGGSACGTPHGAYDDPGDPAGEVRVAWNQEPFSLNNNTIHSNAVANGNINYLIHSGFSYYDADLNLINNDQYGTCTLDSLDPLTITYRINEGVTWSDGVQIDAADMMMAFGGVSGQYNDEGTVTTIEGLIAAADADGQPIVVSPDGVEITSAEEAYAAAFDPETGGIAEGYTYKESAGVAFDSSSEGWELVTQPPVISEDGLALTLTYDSFYVDYQNLTPSPTSSEAAHIVAGRALGIEDPAAAKQALIDAFMNRDGEALRAIAEFWNTGFDTVALPDDPGLYLSSGAYNLTGYTERTELTFEAREDYAWGPQTQIQTMVYRIIGDPTAAVQAMENEEIDMIQPQATSDILTQLEGLADRGIEVQTGDGATYEHIDLAVNNGGPFDPAAYDGDAATALAVRQAFLKTIPRQEIIDRLIIPLNPNATIRNSFNQVPGSPLYDEIAANNGMAEYDTVDIAGAQALLEGAGVTTPIQVRFHYAANNPRRASEYELIRDSAAQAGFEVIDGANIDWGSLLPNTDIYDAALFGWQTTAVAVADSEANFVTGGNNNFYGYSSEVVDGLYEQLKGETDPAVQADLLLQIEQQLVADAFGVSIFQFPEVLAYNSNYVAGAGSIPLSPTMFYAFWEWTVPSA
jgi:peptide/nickel transport system substrate-binding protein